MSRAAMVSAVASLALAALAAPAGAAAAVRLNDLQVIGSHNSYHLEPSPPEKLLRVSARVPGEEALEYSHASLTRQLQRQDVRQLELDLFADPVGGLYAAPRLRALAGEGAYDLAMFAPGTKVLHIQDYDYRTNCLSLVACLAEVKAWSDDHRDHVPIAILLELKDQRLPPQITSVEPVAWTPALMDAVDAEIRFVFTPDRLIVPDDVRAGRSTLSSAVPTGRWPTLQASRGKVMFLMANRGARFRGAYLAGHASLAGRVMFTNSKPGRADAAFVEIPNPLGRGTGRIRSAVRRGYMVRTRADADTREARRNDRRRRDAALASGAHWVSTDYPARRIAARFGTRYVVRLGRPARCNPVTAPRSCRDSALEP